ncbi:MAG: C39 family peptidase [Cyanobacteria bacterium J06592_8]
MSLYLLDVPYYSQRDNTVDPGITCNPSSCCMVAEFIQPGSFGGSDDEYIRQLYRGYGKAVEHDSHTRLLVDSGFKTEFRYDLDYSDLNASLFDRKLPVVIGVMHRGYYKTPTGSHMMVIVGHDSHTGEYIGHDPWGQSFHYSNEDGSNVRLPLKSLNPRWLCEGDNSGWGRLFF